MQETLKWKKDAKVRKHSEKEKKKSDKARRWIDDKSDTVHTLTPVLSWYSLMARHITRPTGSMAFTPSLPVEVLMKSAPAIIATREARYTVVRDPSSPTARMAFMWAGPHAWRMATSSSYRPVVEGGVKEKGIVGLGWVEAVAGSKNYNNNNNSGDKS